MATNFPTSLDNLSNPAGSDPINNPSHAVQHANVNDAIEALESKVGVTNSVVTSTLDYRVKQLETNPTYTNEMAQDAVAAALAAGTHTNITINYNDTGNSISISAAAGYTNEEAVDAVAAALTAGSGISISYNDPANTITISVDSSIATKSYVDTAITSLGNTAATTYVPQSDVGNIDGVASLDGTGKVPDAQIPAGIARDSEVSSAISTEVTNRNSAISTAVNNLINSAPGTLDTLGEIATALAADESAAAALTTLVNTKAPIASPTFTGTVSGITKAMVGLGSVDNTSDTDKPISTATQTALDGKVSKAGGDIITSSLASTIPLTIKGAASQTANLQEWQTSDGSVNAQVTSGGILRSVYNYFNYIQNTSGSSNAYIDLSSGNTIKIVGGASYTLLTVKGAASQTANLQEWQNSAGTKMSTVSPLGYLSINKSYTSYPLEVNGSLYAGNATAGNLYIQGGNNLIYPSVLTGAGGNGWTSVTPNYAVAPDGTTTATRYVWSTVGSCYVYPSYITNTPNSTYTASVYVKPNNSTGKFGIRVGTTVSSMYAVGDFNLSDKSFTLGGVVNGINSSASSIYVGNGWYRIWVTTTVTGSYDNLTGMISASLDGGDVSVWGMQLEKGYYASAYTPTTNAAITYTNNLYVPSGNIYSPSIQSVVSGTATLNTNGDTGGILINTVAAANKGLVIKGAASQTADLQQWQNSAGTVLTSVDKDGYLQTPRLVITNGGNITDSAGTTPYFGFGSNSIAIYARNASYKPLIIQGAASQTANLQEWQNSAGSVLAKIDSAGNFLANSIYAGGNFTVIYAAGFGNIAPYTNSSIVAVTTAAASNLGIIVRGVSSQTGDLQQWQNSAGSALTRVTSSGVLGTSVGVYSPFYQGNNGVGGTIAFANATAITITPQSASVASLIVKGATSQTANLQEWQDSGGTTLGFFNAYGTLTANNRIYAGWAAFGSGYGTAASASNIVLIAKGSASQTANLQEWQNSAGTTLAYIASNGYFNTGASAAITGALGVYGGITTVAGGPAAAALITKGVASQTADLQQWQTSAGQTNLSVNFGGALQSYIQMTADNTNSGITSFIAKTTYANVKPMIVQGAASQSANLQEWQNSAGTVLSSITSSGDLNFASNLWNIKANGTNIMQWQPYTGSMFLGYGSSNTPITIQASSGQTGDLQKWTDVSTNVLARVAANGAMFTVTPADSTNNTQVATTAYVKSNINNLINSAPGTLDTLNELATALGNDANFSTTITNSLASKAPIASPTFTGTPLAPTATSGTNTTQIATTAFVKTAIDTSVQPGAVYQTSAPSSPAVGQIWIDSDEDVTTFDPNIIRRKAITATAGQTVFTADLPFIDGFEQIFMNGLLLVKTTDYSTSGGNTVTLTSAAAASDVIEIVSVTGANSINTYTQAEVNALLAANTSVAPLSISANTTLVAKKRYFVTSASALTLTLPASPALNDEIQIVDASGNASTYNITVARNANKINGNTVNLIIDTPGAWISLIYTGSTYGWRAQ